MTVSPSASSSTGTSPRRQSWQSIFGPSPSVVLAAVYGQWSVIAFVNNIHAAAIRMGADHYFKPSIIPCKNKM
jgi:hypothetical protein